MRIIAVEGARADLARVEMVMELSRVSGLGALERRSAERMYTVSLVPYASVQLLLNAQFVHIRKFQI